MDGYIKIVVTPTDDGEQIIVDVNIREVDLVDKMRLLRAFCQALHLNEAHLLMFIATKKMLDDASESTTIDMSGLRGFMQDCEDDDDDD